MDVNKQLLDAISSLIDGGAFDLTDSPKSLVSNLRRIVNEAKAIAAAEQAQHHCKNCEGVQPETCVFNADRAQQDEPVAWHTNDPCVSGKHIEAIAKVCKIIPSYTTAEYVARIVGFGHVLLADKSVQEAFVRANSHLLRTDPTQPPAVAVPYGWHAAMSFARSALAEAIQIAPLDRLPRMAGAAMQQIDALLADAKKP